MEEKERFKETYEQLLSYVKDRFELLRLQIAERSVRELSALLTKLVIGVLFCGFLFFASIALAIFLGESFDSLTLGFLFVSGGYLFLFLVLALLRKPLLQKPVMSNMIRNLFKDKEDE